MQWKRSRTQPCLSFLISICSNTNQHGQRRSITLTITTTLMENAFEIKEGGVKDRRIYRNKEENREGNNAMTEWKQGNRTERSVNMGFPNDKHPSTLLPPLIRMCVDDFPPLLAWQISPGHHDRPWHRLHWNKGLAPVPNVLVYPQAPLYSITPSVLNAQVS